MGITKKHVGRIRLASVVSALAAITLAAAGCSSSGGSSSSGSGSGGSSGGVGGAIKDAANLSADQLYAKAAKEGEITWYTSTNATADADVKKAWDKTYPKVKLNIVQKISLPLWQQFQQEQNAGKHVADVLCVSTWGVANAAHTNKFTTPYIPKLVTQKYPQYANVSPGAWASRVITIPLVYNTRNVPAADAPTSWSDLLKPFWKGKVGIMDPLQNAYGLASAYQLSQKLGKDYFTKLKKNDPKLYTQSGQQENDIVSGALDAALMTGYAARGALNQGAPLKIVYPSDGTPVQTNFVSLVASAPHPYAALLFENWLATAPAQSARVKVDADYPTNPDATLGYSGQPKLSTLTLLKHDDQKMAADQSSFNDWFKSNVGG